MSVLRPGPVLPSLKGQSIEELRAELEEWARALQEWAREVASVVNE